MRRPVAIYDEKAHLFCVFWILIFIQIQIITYRITTHSRYFISGKVFPLGAMVVGGWWLMDDGTY